MSGLPKAFLPLAVMPEAFVPQRSGGRRVGSMNYVYRVAGAVAHTQPCAAGPWGAGHGAERPEVRTKGEGQAHPWQPAFAPDPSQKLA